MKTRRSAVEGARETPEYLDAKRLLAERKKLQASLRSVNSALRTLQVNARDSVSLAKVDLQSESAQLNSFHK